MKTLCLVVLALLHPPVSQAGWSAGAAVAAPQAQPVAQVQQQRPPMVRSTEQRLSLGLHWAATPGNPTRLAGAELADLRFVVEGGHGTVVFSFTAPRHPGAFHQVGSATQRATTLPPPDKPSDPEEARTAGRPRTRPRTRPQLAGSTPTNTFVVRFAGVPEGSFAHGQEYDTITASVTDDSGAQISRTVRIILTHPLSWCKTGTTRSSETVGWEAPIGFTYGTQHGSGTVRFAFQTPNHPEAFETLPVTSSPLCPQQATLFGLRFKGLSRYPGTDWRETVTVRAMDAGGGEIEHSFTLAIEPRCEHCFGAVGSQCGWGQSGSLPLSTCNPVTSECLINGGSWAHDQCCAANPEGHMCDPGGTDVCETAWNLAVSRTTENLSWARRVNFDKRNCTGEVVFADYCAKANSIVHKDDARYCCNGARHFNCSDAGDLAKITSGGHNPALCGTLRLCL